MKRGDQDQEDEDKAKSTSEEDSISTKEDIPNEDEEEESPGRKRMPEVDDDKYDRIMECVNTIREASVNHIFMDHDQDKARKQMKRVIHRTDELTGHVRATKRRLRDVDRAERHTRKALNSDLIMLQYMEDSLRDRRKWGEKEMKKSRKDLNGTKRRLSEDGEETEDTQRRSKEGKTATKKKKSESARMRADQAQTMT